MCVKGAVFVIVHSVCEDVVDALFFLDVECLCETVKV